MAWLMGFAFLAGVGLLFGSFLVASVLALSRQVESIEDPDLSAAYFRHLVLSQGVSVLLAVVASGGVGWYALHALDGSPFALLWVLLIVVLAPAVTAILASNWTAALGNENLRRVAVSTIDGGGSFVGLSSEESFFNQLVDTHDDVGLLRLERDQLVFHGMRGTRSIPKAAVLGVRRLLIWQFVYLGSHWLVIDYQDQGRRKALRVESREGRTLLTHKKSTDTLAGTVTSWLETN